MSVAQIYRFIVDDVIKNVKAEFVAEGLDEGVLNELQQIWETKIIQTGSLAPASLPISDGSDYGVPTSTFAYDPSSLIGSAYANNNNPYIPQDHTPFPQIDLGPHMYMGQQNYLNTTTDTRHYSPPPPITPMTSTPPPPSAAAQLAANALRSLNSSPPYDSASLGKPPQFISPPSLWNNPLNLGDNKSNPNGAASLHNILRQHDGAGDEHDFQTTTDTTIQNKWEQAKQIDNIMLEKYKEKQLRKGKSKKKVIPQVDGLGDDEDSEGAGGDSPKDDEELDSDLDDEDDAEPETENFILCQYEKVTRVKNKRKTNLKDGIMHLNGKDSVFHKATGEFEW